MRPVRELAIAWTTGDEAAKLRAWCPATVQGNVRSSALLVLAALATLLLDRSIGSFTLVLVLLALGSWRIARRFFRARTVADTFLLALTTASAWIVVIAEVSSLMYRFGYPSNWVAGSTALYLLSIWFPPTPRTARPSLWSWVPENIFGRMVLLALGVQLLLLFFVTFFTGINISDSVVAYLPRSVRYVQNGSFAIYDTHYDYLPAFHQVVVGIQILFLRSDVLVVPTSFLTGVAVSVGIFAFARSLGWRCHLPLVAALLLWTAPAFVLHASAPNFDILTGLWLLLSLYFLRRGYAATDLRWIAAAALATGLGLATKLTFAFAAPALALIWAATLARAVLRGRRTRAVRLVAVAALAVALIGLPFLVRNVVLQGYLLGPPQLQSFLSGTMGPLERLRLLGFNVLTLGFQLVTPPSLLSREAAARLNETYLGLASSFGYVLPDPQLALPGDLETLIRHAAPGHQYDSNHASFGAAFVLVILPSMLAVPFARRQLGARWPYAVAVLGVWVVYFVTLGLVYLYHPASIRFLIEPMIVVAVIAPAWLALLPRRIAAIAIVALALPLIAEAKDVIVNSRWAPPARVMQTPRVDQLTVFAGAPPADAVRALDRKYPPRLVPMIYIDDPGTGHPGFPDYTFLGPSLQRRTRYWAGRSGNVPPGPFLTNDSSVAEALTKAGMVPDRLSADFWLLLPNDRLRVRVAVVQARPDEGPILRLVASVPPGRYRAPRFAFLQSIGDTTRTLRPDAEEPTFDLPLTFANRQGTLRITVRDGDQQQPAETVELDRTYLLGL